MQRTRRTRRTAALTLLAGIVALGVLGAPGVAATAAPFGLEGPAAPAQASTTISLAGHGYGHGRGMGQYGAQGYATLSGWSWQQIVEHFYGGTRAATRADDPLTVVLNAPGSTSASGLTTPTVVGVEQGVPSIGIGTDAPWAAPAPYVRLTRVSATLMNVQFGTSCSGPWGAALPAGTSSIRVVTDNPTNIRERTLVLCDGVMAGGNANDRRWLRGEVVARATATRQYTTNVVGVQQYLYGVVTRESPSWFDADALAAQAVAARSYALADAQSKTTFYGFTATCDTTSCQQYGGRLMERGGVRTGETTAGTTAVNATAGVVRESTANGAVARTEFSASTGGWTAGGTFTAVEDLGDAVSSNAYHDWSTTIPVATVEAAYGQAAGTFRRIEVTARNGLGEDGGRVTGVRVVFASTSFSRTGTQFQSTFGLRSDWFTITSQPGGLPAQPPTAGGWVLRADGTLSAFGGAPARTGPSLGTAARAVDVAGDGGRGYVLASNGTLTPVGGAPAGGGPTWTFDIANDVAVRADGTSGYKLDGYGGVHAFGGAAVVAQQPAPYRSDRGPEWARRLVLRSDGASGYVAFADGTVAPFNSAPAVTSPALPAGRDVRGIVLAADERSGWLVLDDGSFLAFGGAAARTGTGRTPTLSADGRPDGSGVALDDQAVAGFGGAGGGYPADGSAALVDVALAVEPPGYVLDGYGGLHPVGGAPAAIGFQYWPGSDVARRVVVGPEGNGFVLDLYGGLHGFGTARAAKPVATGAPYWPGWAIARDVALLPGGGLQGYVLDGWGGVHPINGAPAVVAQTYFGFDIARALLLDPNGNGGWVLDGWGGVHPFAIAGRAAPPTLTTGTYTPGTDRWRGIALTAAGQGYLLASDGTVVAFGGAAACGATWPGGVGAAVAVDSLVRGWVTTLSGFGATTPCPAGGAGQRAAAATWPTWNIARDLAFRPT